MSAPISRRTLFSVPELLSAFWNWRPRRLLSATSAAATSAARRTARLRRRIAESAYGVRTKWSAARIRTGRSASGIRTGRSAARVRIAGRL
jgi:hypothetical protein